MPAILRSLRSALLTICLTGTSTATRPDILFIVFDDMNDATTLHHPEQGISTPNLERLAKRGTFFRRACCAAPVCNPSRTAALTGLRPATSGIYGNPDHWREALPGRKTLPAAFRHHGYHVRGAGEIFHAGPPSPRFDHDAFDIYQPTPPKSYPPEKLNRAPEYGSRNTDWGAWPPDENDAPDTATVSFTIDSLAKPPADRPLFFACGFLSPHSPFFAPAAYHRPLEETTMPQLKPGDTDDLPTGARNLLKPTRWFREGMMKLEVRLPGSHREFVAAYTASCRFTDGSEELYDHSNDPNEWTNLAGTPEAADIVASHRKWLPASEAPPAGQPRP